MIDQNTELFDLAVKLIRRGTHYVDLTNELEQAALPGTDVREVIAAAGKWVDEVQKESLACAIEAFKRGRSFFDVCKTLEKCGFHPYDATIVAGRAKAKAEEEQKAETEQVSAEKK